MRIRSMVVAIAVGAVFVTVAPAARPIGRQAPAGCSKAAAADLVKQQALDPFLLADPVRGVLCGPFTGPASSAMVVMLNAPTCWSLQRWFVFTSSGGTWRLELTESRFSFPVVAVGSALRETNPVFRPGDPRCVPSGGRHSRTWRWNGSRLVPGPYGPATGAKPAAHAAFYTPSRQISCEMVDVPTSRGVTCAHTGPPVSSNVTLAASGRLTVCQHADRGCEGDFGENFVPRALAYGRSITAGRFRCSSAQTGVTCVVTRTGAGFQISRTGVRRVPD
jgi:hypothetical protein